MRMEYSETLTSSTMLEMMTRKGKARLTSSQISTGLILRVLGRLEETER